MILENLGFTCQGYEDLRVPLLSTVIHSRPPTLSLYKNNGATSQGVYAYSFDPSTINECFFHMQLPHGWLTGTTIYPHVHWGTQVNGAINQKVAWALEYTFADINGIFPNAVLIGGNTPIGWQDGDNIIAYRHYKTNIGSGIDLSSIHGVSAMLLCRVFRDATSYLTTDDYPDAAFGFEFDSHYISRRIGSPAIGGP